MRYKYSLFTVVSCLYAFCSCVGSEGEKKETSERIPLQKWLYSEISAESAKQGKQITIPHSWNCTDIQDGGGKDNMSKDGYRRAPSWYFTEIGKPDLSKRTFIRFGAVSSAAEISLNGEKIGEHRGAATAFAFELTSKLKSDQTNTITVKADNTWCADLPPISGDFGVPGGIYRKVELIQKPMLCLSPVVNGSHGISLTQLVASKTEAKLKIVAYVDSVKKCDANILYQIVDAQDNVVAENNIKQSVDGMVPVETVLVVKSPHLWNGIKDPYLYNVKVTVTGKLDNQKEMKDQYVLKTGFRTILFDKDKGTFLNGEPFPLRGVNRHQDRENQIWAITEEQEKEDVQMILDIGANTVRAAHYPHSEVFLSECDRVGLVVWAELPVIDTVSDDPVKFEMNAKTQLTEMIAQQRHHPSVCCWSIYNEIGHRRGKNPVPVLKALNNLAHQLDATRPTAAATNQQNKEFNNITDIMAFNAYPGWYGGGNGSLTGHVKGYKKSAPDKAWGISEYGAGASLSQQDDSISKGPAPAGKWHPEAWQSRVHENALASINQHPELWGTFVWNMFDFASPWRSEGERNGINDKGLVTYDRKICKDAFYLYQANWSNKPVLHLLARRDNQRKSADTVIRYYTNLKNVSISLNNKKLESGILYAPSGYIIKNVKLKEGKNIIKATGKSPNGKIIEDKIEWILKTK